MAFDGFVTRGIVLELKKLLTGGRIEKIYHPEKNDVVFYITNNRIKYKLFASVDTGHGGIYLSEENFENPSSPSGFCMLLRKHLLNGKIINVVQKDWDRIVEVVVESHNEMGFPTEKKIIVEIMNKHSNIILVDVETEKMIDAIKRVSLDSSKVRQIIPGLPYSYPPKQDKILPDEFVKLAVYDEYLRQIKDSDDILNKISGLSPLLSREIFYSSNMQKHLESLINSVTSMSFDINTYYDSNEKLVDFHILPISQYKSLYKKPFDTISQCICDFYSGRESSNRIKQKSSDLKKHISSLLKKLYLKQNRLLDDLKKAENDDKYQLYGELLTANLHMVKKGDKSIEVLNYYTGEMINIKLDELLSPSQNAQKFYKKYSKSKKALVEKNIQLDIAQNDINYLLSTLEFINMAESVSTLDDIREELISQGFLRRKQSSKRLINSRKSAKSRKNILSYTSPSGFNILVGKNNVENDFLTTKLADNRDLWFHTKDIHGSHVILESKGAECSENDILYTAQIAAYYSKGRDSDNIPVDYVAIKHVKKPSGAKPGMVIFTHNKTVYVNGAIPE